MKNAECGYKLLIKQSVDTVFLSDMGFHMRLVYEKQIVIKKCLKILCWTANTATTAI
jgi:hypothetical protein